MTCSETTGLPHPRAAEVAAPATKLKTTLTTQMTTDRRDIQILWAKPVAKRTVSAARKQTTATVRNWPTAGSLRIRASIDAESFDAVAKRPRHMRRRCGGTLAFESIPRNELMPGLSEVRYSKADACNLCIKPLGQTFDGRCAKQLTDKRFAAVRTIHRDAKGRLQMRGMALSGSAQHFRPVSFGDLAKSSHTLRCPLLLKPSLASVRLWPNRVILDRPRARRCTWRRATAFRRCWDPSTRLRRRTLLGAYRR